MPRKKKIEEEKETIEIEKPIEHLQTYDIIMAAVFYAYGFFPSFMEYNPSTKKYCFYFVKEKILEGIYTELKNRTLQIDPYLLWSSMRFIKSQIHYHQQN